MADSEHSQRTTDEVEIPEIDERWQAHSPLPPEPGDAPKPNYRRPRPAKASGSLVCGIVSVALSLFSPLICWITGIVAIFLAISYRRDDPADKVAKAGLILGIVGVVVGAIVFSIAFITSLMVTAQYYGI